VKRLYYHSSLLLLFCFGCAAKPPEVRLLVPANSKGYIAITLMAGVPLPKADPLGRYCIEIGKDGTAVCPVQLLTQYHQLQAFATEGAEIPIGDFLEATERNPESLYCWILCADENNGWYYLGTPAERSRITSSDILRLKPGLRPEK
jgi:hypothetical protein